MRDLLGLRRVPVGVAAAMALLLTLAGCGQEAARYTLYRHGAVTPSMSPDERDRAAKARIHVATFNAHRLDARNEDNCRIAAGMFSAHDGTPGGYWCELGPYHP